MRDNYEYCIPDEMAEIARHVLHGECPPLSVDGISGCSWAGDCTECWWSALWAMQEMEGGKWHRV